MRYISNNAFHIVVFFMFLLISESFPKILFQENFEDPQPKYYSFETKSPNILSFQGSKALVMNLSNFDIFRFKTPWMQARSFCIDITPLGWPAKGGTNMFLSAESYITTGTAFTSYNIFFMGFTKGPKNNPSI